MTEEQHGRSAKMNRAQRPRRKRLQRAKPCKQNPIKTETSSIDSAFSRDAQR